MGHPEESVSTMQAAMNLPGVKKAGKQIAWEFLRRNSIKHVFRSSLVAVLLFVSGRLGLRWLDIVFQGQYLPSLSVNYVTINKDLEKLTPQLY